MLSQAIKSLETQLAHHTREVPPIFVVANEAAQMQPDTVESS
jgi:hypothetical protein